jgi:hypothetical protein
MGLLKEWVADMEGDFPATDLVYSVFHNAMEAGLANQGNQGLINVWDDAKISIRAAKRNRQNPVETRTAQSKPATSTQG